MIFSQEVRKYDSEPKENSSKANAQNLLLTFEQGVFDAMEKKYLSRLLMNIHDEKSKKVLESYSFKFDYDDMSKPQSLAKPKSKKVTREEVQTSTKNLLKRLIVLTQALSELPVETFVTVNLMYTDSTPADYEPPLFGPIRRSDIPDFDESPLSIKIGETRTGFSSFVLKVRKPDSGVAEKLPKSQEMDQTVLEEEFDDKITEPEYESMEEKFGKSLNIESPTPKKLDPDIKKDLSRMSRRTRTHNASQDSLYADRENSDPMEKASAQKRKILCVDQKSQKPKKSFRLGTELANRRSQRRTTAAKGFAYTSASVEY